MTYACLWFSCFASSLIFIPVSDERRYPAGYHLLYVPYYSSDYSGYHWAVYNDNNIFYSFDDGDTTPGEICDYTRAACNQIQFVIGPNSEWLVQQPTSVSRDETPGSHVCLEKKFDASDYWYNKMYHHPPKPHNVLCLQTEELFESYHKPHIVS